MSELSNETKLEIVQLIKDNLACAGVCGWNSGEWQNRLNEEMSVMVQEHVLQLRQTIVTELLPQFSKQVIDAHASTLELINNSLRESRMEFNRSLDNAVATITSKERDCLGEVEEIAAQQVHTIVNGNLNKIIQQLEDIEVWKVDHVSDVIVPSYFKSLFSKHPVKFISSVSIFTIILFTFILRLYHVAIPFEQSVIELIKHIL